MVMALSYPQAAQTTKFPTNHGCETGIGRCINLFQNSGFLREGIAGPGGLQRGQKKGEHCGFFYGENDDIN
jgi:hypothetical protein